MQGYTVHYEIGPYKEPYLVEFVVPTVWYGDEQPPDWSVVWSQTLKPGESQDVPWTMPPPVINLHVQFKTTAGSLEDTPGTIMYKTGGLKPGDKITVTADQHIVVSR
ncbi:MAG: hypothetical protein ABSD98_13750 [Candidatus Korobacteraceae bacterium]|jgi:hypothetical protein